MGPSGGTSTGPSSGTRKRLEEEEQSNEWRYGATVVSNEALRLELARTKQVKRELVKETADLKSGSEQMKEEVEEVEEDVVVLDVELVRIKDFWGQEFRELRRKEETLGEKVEQAVLALGNIADKSPTLRDLVLEQNTLNSLLELLNEGSKLSMRRIASWTLRRFCDGELQPDQFVQLKDALPALARLV